MNTIKIQDLNKVSAGNKFFNILGGGILGGAINGVVCIPAGGPIAFFGCFMYGFIEGTGSVIVAENVKGVYDTVQR